VANEGTRAALRAREEDLNLQPGMVPLGPVVLQSWEVREWELPTLPEGARQAPPLLPVVVPPTLRPLHSLAVVSCTTFLREPVLKTLLLL